MAGINFGEGNGVFPFRIRDRAGRLYWAGGTARSADGIRRVFSPAEVSFEVLRQWKSAASGATYPVAMRIRAAGMTIDLEPLMDDQELDSRASTGTIYWEGAVRASRAGRELGRGYLELTGYAARLKL